MLALLSILTRAILAGALLAVWIWHILDVVK
jgi:hypothetical protein